MGTSSIEWLQENDGKPGKVWNPITGCTPISEGCRNCYARRMATRLAGRYGYPKDDPFRVTFHPERLEDPLQWKKPSRIFVVSMGDLFHQRVPDEFFSHIWQVMAECRHHTFFLLTKRIERVSTFLAEYRGEGFLGNIWFGVSVEDQPTADERIPILLQIPAVHRWVSIEPMLQNILIKWWLDGNHETGNKINWLVCGGESGPGARPPPHPNWIRSIRDQCQGAGVPFFFKGWGTGKFLQDTEISDWVEAGYDPFEKGGGKLAFIDGKQWKEKPFSCIPSTL